MQGRWVATVWLAERPSHYSGKWGVGCCLCANLLANLSRVTAPNARSKLRRYSTKWARYEISSAASMQAAAVWKHATQAIHKRAASFFTMASLPTSSHWIPSEDDDKLLSGFVPQPSDWLHSWRYAISPISFNKSAKLLATEDFLFIGGVRHRPIQRKVFRSMARIMAESEREKGRELLRKSSHATIACDDKGDYRTIRLKCAYICEDGSVKSSLLLLGVLHRGGNVDTSIQAFDKDYCEKFLESMRFACGRFCTPLGKELDRDLLKRLYQIVCTACGDGHFGLQKALKSQISIFPHLSLVIRDACHAIRIATRDPLRFEETFGEHWKSVFEDFIPRFTNSGF